MLSAIRLISTHRLDPEKGWDLILTRLQSILNSQFSILNSGLSAGNGELSNGEPCLPAGRLRIEYDIYGDGVLRLEIEELAKQYPESIRYHGFVPLQTIFDRGVDYDFMLMPSRFLETFGLSALDFAQFGVPTIGYKKGGARAFIQDKTSESGVSLNIFDYPGITEQGQFNNAMNTILTVASQAKSQGKAICRVDTQLIQKIYSQKSRFAKFSSLLSLGKQ